MQFNFNNQFEIFFENFKKFVLMSQYKPAPADY